MYILYKKRKEINIPGFESFKASQNFEFDPLSQT